MSRISDDDATAATAGGHAPDRAEKHNNGHSCSLHGWLAWTPCPHCNISKLREAVSQLLDVVKHPENGALHCRWCIGGTTHNKPHEPQCHYLQIISEIEKAKSVARYAMEASK